MGMPRNVYLGLPWERVCRVSVAGRRLQVRRSASTRGHETKETASMDNGSRSILEQLSKIRTFTADDVLAFARVTGASTVHA
jgi:hypothetical protein